MKGEYLYTATFLLFSSIELFIPATFEGLAHMKLRDFIVGPLFKISTPPLITHMLYCKNITCIQAKVQRYVHLYISRRGVSFS